MKKFMEIGTTICLLAVTILLAALCGKQFLQMRAGAEPLAAGEALEQAEGKYVSYEVAYPVASYGEEYYSGDPDRLKKTGYVVFDEERNAFLYIVISTDRSGGFQRLLRNWGLSGEAREGRDMSPVTVEGTLMAMDTAAIERALSAMSGKDSISNRNQEIDLDALAEAQTDWYMIEDEIIGGRGTSEIGFSIVAVVFTLLILIGRLLGYLKRKGKDEESTPLPSSSSKLDTFLYGQKGWIKEWCEHVAERSNRSIYLTVLCVVVILCVIGIVVKVPPVQVLTFYLPIGLIFGEMVAVPVWLGQRKASDPRRIMKKLRKNIGKELPSPDAQEAFAEDMLNAGEEWSFGEQKKDSKLCGIVGSRYWATFSGNGAASIYDSADLKRIMTGTVAGEIRTGRVRTSYMYYIVKLYNQHPNPKRDFDKGFQFDTEEKMDDFINMIRKRTGDAVDILEDLGKIE